MSKQVTMICLDELVPSHHIYRQFFKLFNFRKIEYRLKKLELKNGANGYGIVRLFKCLLYQFMENLSDRQIEEAIKTNTVCKWFCGFNLTEKTPDHSLFGQIRARIGTHQLSKLFQIMRTQLKEKGYMSEVFTFVDASHLVAKASLWEERDKVIKQRYKKLNNATLPRVAYDKQARIGCKGKNKFWYGYKKHVGVDMQSGLINKVAVTPANLTDAQGFKHVCPNSGAVYADKGYCVKPAIHAAAKRGVHLAAIKKNNMLDKNRDLDRWLTKVRAPYERVFSGQNRRVRYCGIAKNQFAEFMNAICFNLRRLLVLPQTGQAV